MATRQELFEDSDDAPLVAPVPAKPVHKALAEPREPSWLRAASPVQESVEDPGSQPAASDGRITCVLCGRLLATLTSCGSKAPSECSAVSLRCLSERQRKKLKVS